MASNFISLDAVATAIAEDEKPLHQLLVTDDQVGVLVDMMRRDLVDFPEAYADCLHFRALYVRVHAIAKEIGLAIGS